ncbi:MAG: hypothetical protein ABIG39_04170 [Candidatus Micrarchaeota archaeon]
MNTRIIIAVVLVLGFGQFGCTQPEVTCGKHKLGDKWLAEDGCNTCICGENGEVACTLMDCLGDIQRCEQLATQLERDSCYTELAISKKNSSLCGKIEGTSDITKRYYCYANSATEVSVCDSINNDDYRHWCYATAQQYSGECIRIHDGGIRNKCYESFGQIDNCTEEGEIYAVVPDALPCCEGLTPIDACGPDSEGNCGEACAGAVVCTKCGDGICKKGENKCNCPEDCLNDTGTNRERMKEKLMERQEEIWDGEFPNEEFELGECKGKNIFLGEGVINIVGWNQEVDYYNFLECPQGISLEELAELRKEESEELGGVILDKNVSIEKEIFEEKEILVKRIEVEIVGIEPHERMHYTDRYEYRFYNCEGIVLEGISRIFGNDDWEPRKRYFVEVFNEMISVCK